jgi:hypothetical protein
MRTVVLLIVSMLSCFVPTQSFAQNGYAHAPRPSLNTDDVVREMVARNHARVQALRSFVGRRYYTLDYSGFPGRRHAEMLVEARYQAPDSKQFTIVSQSGSAWLVDHVLKKLLQSESEGARNHERIEITPENYDFALLGREASPGGVAYVLSVKPRAKNKYLYRGKIWVDAADFAITRIEAEPAVNPSFWTKKSEIHHTYTKVGDFWLPLQNDSISTLRLGGRAVLRITYSDYRITEARRQSGAEGVSQPATSATTR